MSARLHVANLEVGTGDAELEALFRPCGGVRRARVTTVRSSGCETATGLVEMGSHEACESAIATLDGRGFRGLSLAVSWATETDHPMMFETMNAPEDGNEEEPRGPAGPIPDGPGDGGGGGSPGVCGRARQDDGDGPEGPPEGPPVPGGGQPGVPGPGPDGQRQASPGSAAVPCRGPPRSSTMVMAAPETNPADAPLEGELGALFRLSLDMLCIASLDGRFQRVNPAFERALGHTAAQLLSRPFIDFVHPDDRVATAEAVAALARGDPVCRFENRYRCADGTYHWLSWTSVSGGGGRIYAVARDVTEARAADEALRGSERRYVELLRAVTTYAYSVEVRGGRAESTTHGEGVESVTGFPAGAFEGDPYLWFTMIHPDDRDRVRGHVARVLADEPVPPIEHRARRADGDLRWLRNTVIRHHDRAGALVRYDGVVQDVTDQKRVEEHFRALVECAPDAIVVTDARGRIVHVNRRTEDLFGYDRAELLGRTVEILVPDRLRDRHASRRLELAASGGGRAMGDRADLFCRRKDGREFPAEISLAPIGDAGGALTYASIRDVSELRRAQARDLDNQVQQRASQRIQQRLLPGGPPALAGFDIAGASHPSAMAGGDLFDFVPWGDGSLGLAVGDASGHGIAAALVMASAHAYLRVLATADIDAGEVLGRANALIARETEDTRFVTLLLVRLDPQTGSFTYAGAGHPTGYLLDDSGAIKAQLASTSLPLGVEADERFPTLGPLSVAPGDLLLLVTDGLLEALSPDDRPFGVAGVLDLVRANRHRPAAEIVDILYRAVLAFSGRDAPQDDVTIVIVKVGRPAAPAG